jgi:hypothetical protein
MVKRTTHVWLCSWVVRHNAIKKRPPPNLLLPLPMLLLG